MKKRLFRLGALCCVAAMTITTGVQALSVEEARLDGHWLRVDSLESNALALYEFTPQLSPGEDPDA